MALSPSLPGTDGSDAVARVVREAIGLLGGDAAGVLLFGNQARAPVLRILDGVRALPLAPARFDAANGTVEGLRAEVERVHAARSLASMPLLLVVDEADRLNGALLHELEQAAAAAATLGGLKFLFVSRHELADRVRSEALPALARCMETSLRCDRAAVVVPDAGERPYRQPAESEAPPSGLPRLLVAGGILALLVAVLVIGISHLGAPVPPPQVASLAVPPPLQSAPMPLAAPMPAPPVQPPVAVPAPVAPVPVVPAPIQGPPPPALPPPVASAPPAPPIPAPASLLLIAGPGDTLASLYARVYRDTVPPPFAQVAAINPTVIGIGTRLEFPAPPAGWSPAR